MVFSGKASKKVNGLYKRGGDEKTIVLHNKNFSNDDTLMFTAIHELTHHVLITELGYNPSKSHSQVFWAMFNDLVDKAEAEGIYRPVIDKET